MLETEILVNLYDDQKKSQMCFGHATLKSQIRDTSFDSYLGCVFAPDCKSRLLEGA